MNKETSRQPPWSNYFSNQPCSKTPISQAAPSPGAKRAASRSNSHIAHKKRSSRSSPGVLALPHNIPLQSCREEGSFAFSGHSSELNEILKICCRPYSVLLTFLELWSAVNCGTGLIPGRKGNTKQHVANSSNWLLVDFYDIFRGSEEIHFSGAVFH